jgi:hypothetical protein
MRRIELPKLMQVGRQDQRRLDISARDLLAAHWANAFPKPKRRRLTFPKKAIPC